MYEICNWEFLRSDMLLIFACRINLSAGCEGDRFRKADLHFTPETGHKTSFYTYFSNFDYLFTSAGCTKHTTASNVVKPIEDASTISVDSNHSRYY